MTAQIESIQRALGVQADGIFGPQTLRAAALFLGVPSTVRDVQRALGVTADGIAGPKTIAALLSRLMQGGVPSTADQSIFPTQAEVRSGKSIFGKAGDESNLTNIVPPYQLYYDGQPVKTIRVHRLIARRVMDALTEIKLRYTPEQIHALKLDRYDGAFNHRKTTTGKALSMHAWGIALDFNAAENAYSTHAPAATLSKPECKAWWEAWERQGFISLGRARNIDWMHLQAARL